MNLSLWYIARETFTLLRRDKIFAPFIIVTILVTAIANLASDWAIEDFTKILFDFGAFGYHVTGTLVAIMWGTKTLIDSRSQGSVETQLASPVSRPTWLIGKFLGLAFALLTLAVAFIAIWQLVMFLNRYGMMGKPEILMFAFLTLDWLVMGAVAICFASTMSSAVSLFAACTLWVVGMAAPSVAQLLSPETPLITRTLVEGIARFWNLQQFNLVDAVASLGSFPSPRDLEMRLGYGFCLIAVFLTIGSWSFSKRDLGQ